MLGAILLYHVLNDSCLNCYPWLIALTAGVHKITFFTLYVLVLTQPSLFSWEAKQEQYSRNQLARIKYTYKLRIMSFVLLSFFKDLTQY